MSAVGNNMLNILTAGKCKRKEARREHEEHARLHHNKCDVTRSLSVPPVSRQPKTLYCSAENIFIRVPLKFNECQMLHIPRLLSTALCFRRFSPFILFMFSRSQASPGMNCLHYCCTFQFFDCSNFKILLLFALYFQMSSKLP